jgi:O-antigen ligase
MPAAPTETHDLMLSSRATSTAFGVAFFFLPLSKPLTFASLAVAAVLLVAGGGLRDAVPMRRPPPWGIAAVALAGLPVLSLFVHADGLANTEYLSLSYYWLFALLVHQAAKRMPINGWLLAYVAGTLVTFAYAQAKALGWSATASEPTALRNYILYSQILAVGIVVCALLHRQTRQIGARIAYWVVIGMLAYGLANSQGRTGAIAVLVLMPLIVSSLLPARSLWILLAGCVVGATALLMNPIVQIRIEGFRQEVASLRTGVLQGSLGYRLEMWQTAAHVLEEHPLVGGGPRAFQREWKRRFPEPGVREHFAEPHNAYLFYAAAYGIPGLAALLLLFAANLVRGWRHRDVLAGSLTFAFAVVCLLGSLTNTMLLGTTSALMVMLFVGLQGNLLYPATRAAMRVPAGSA